MAEAVPVRNALCEARLNFEAALFSSVAMRQITQAIQLIADTRFRYGFLMYVTTLIDVAALSLLSPS